jgi:monomeric sarcosine oxidase
MAQYFDAIVIGAGGMGSAAAYYLAKAGQRVLVLEQFELDHQKGSSYGSSRVIRYAYDHPAYIHLIRSTYPLWFALEAEIGKKLYTQTGSLDIGFPNLPEFQALRASMEQTGIPYEQWTKDEVSDRFPQFRLEDGMTAIYQAEAGILAASQCVWAHLHLAQALGAVIQERSPILKIIPKANSVEVYTATEVYYAEQLVITAGGWAKDLLAMLNLDLPLWIMPTQIVFFQPDRPADYGTDRFPVFLLQGVDNHCADEYYGIPTHDGVGVKISTFYGWDLVERPDEVDYNPSQVWIEQIREFLRRYLPGVNGKVVSTRRCLYTMTPDKHFVIDRHPEYPHIVFGAGFSGHGFKFTTLVGSILTDMLLKGETVHDISLFRRSRFLKRETFV